ncbi:MAG: type I-E CRISPR-associated protein Cas6/Cse3/CasE [Gammaproteobacteria bacterium]
MTDDLYLSRLTLKRNPEISALIGTLQPLDSGEAAEAGHRLVWSVMPPAVRAAKDERRSRGDERTTMLWRHEEGGIYYVLGPKPELRSSLFDIETRPFEAALAPGDRLRFMLRVHATVDRRAGGRATARRSDVVMDLLSSVPKDERSSLRLQKAHEAASGWMKRRGEADGFELEGVAVDSYKVQLLARERGRVRSHGIGVLDLQGLVAVTEPDRFIARLRTGFGRAKAFGCGLMLIRRA